MDWGSGHMLGRRDFGPVKFLAAGDRFQQSDRRRGRRRGSGVGRTGRDRKPTFAGYVPQVSAAVTAGTRRVYGSYWNRITEHWGDRRLDEPTPTEIKSLVEEIRANVVVRRNARGGRSAGEHLIRSDSAGCTQGLLAHIRDQREHGVDARFSVGVAITEPIRQAILTMKKRPDDWIPALDGDGVPRPGAQVCELTGHERPRLADRTAGRGA